MLLETKMKREAEGCPPANSNEGERAAMGSPTSQEENWVGESKLLSESLNARDRRIEGAFIRKPVEHHAILAIRISFLANLVHA